MDTYRIERIGTVRVRGERMYLELDEAVRPALQGLEGFDHIVALWWFSYFDDEASRGKLVERAPYRTAPATLGTFATRSPLRPNPIALSVVRVLGIDADAGRIDTAYIDADDGTPLLDIKPYTPSLDRVEDPRVPDWCAHWPRSVEASGAFDWGTEMAF